MEFERIEEIVGRWIATGRAANGQSQAQLGTALGEYLGKPWSRQSISAAEKGDRAFTAAELIAFGLALGCPVEALLEPPADVEQVGIGEGVIDARHLRTAAATNADLTAVAEAMQEMRRRWPQLQDTVTDLDELFQRAVRETWKAARGRGIVVAEEQADAHNELQALKQARRRAAVRRDGDQS